MKMELKKENKLQREYVISFSKEDLNAGVDEVAARIAPKLKMKGYRDGHVPLAVAKQKHLPRLISEFLSDKCQELIDQEISTKELKLATNPVIKDDLNVPEIKDVDINVVMEVRPVVPEMDYGKIEADLPQLEITPEEFNNEIKSLLDSKAKLNVVQDPDYNVAVGNVVAIDFVGSIDGVEFEGGKGENYHLEVGSKTFIDNFEDQLVGHKVGDEFAVVATFPENYQQADLAGKQASFATKINRIYQKETPELDDEFAKSIGLDSLEDLKSKMVSEVTAVMNSAFYAKIKKKLFEVLLSKESFPVPELVVQKEVESRMAAAAQRGESLNQKEVDKDVRRDLAIWYYIQDVINKEDANIKDEDLTDFIARRAVRDNLGDPAAIIQMCASNKALLNAISESFKEERTIVFALNRINANPIKMSKKEFLEYIAKINAEDGSGWHVKRKGLFG